MAANIMCEEVVSALLAMVLSPVSDANIMENVIRWHS
jgi:hypothetical protein